MLYYVDMFRDFKYYLVSQTIVSAIVLLAGLSMEITILLVLFVPPILLLIYRFIR